MTLKTSYLRQLENPSLTPTERAELRCRIARKLEDKGDYEGAREALGELWPDVTERPRVEGLDPNTAAEVLLRAGVVTSSLGGDKGAQERAKNLLSESITIFASLSYVMKVLEAQTELACCYWREGAYDEARIVLRDVLARLTTDSELKAKAVLRSAIVEWSALRYSNSLYILSHDAVLFERIQNHTIKGGYYDALAGVLVNLGTSEYREDYIDRAFVEYAAASFHFEQAGHKPYLANVESNLGFLYFKVGKFSEAHEHLEHARRLQVSLKNSCTTAQVDETRARVFIAQGLHAEAERVAWASVSILERGGRHSLLAEALTTHGVALARLGYPDQSRAALLRAIELAHQSGALNEAGLAAITVIEELSERLTKGEAQNLFERAYQWLSDSQHLQTTHRLLKAASRVLRTDRTTRVEADEIEAGEDVTMREAIRHYEYSLIKQALEKSAGSVTQASRLLGISYQSLASMLERRHKDLLPKRTPLKPRRRSIIKPK